MTHLKKARGEGRIAITYRKGSEQDGYFLESLRNNIVKNHNNKLHYSDE